MTFRIGGVGSTDERLAGFTTFTTRSTGITSSFITEDEFYNTFAVGEHYGWGNGVLGTLGDGTTTTHITPITLATGGRWKKLARTCPSTLSMAAIDEEGKLYVWGAGTLGKISPEINDRLPETIQGIYTPAKWRDVATGNRGMAAIAADGSLWGWGNLYSPSSTPTLLVDSYFKWNKVFAGSQMFAAITDEGEIWFWGYTGAGIPQHLYALPVDWPSGGELDFPSRSSFFVGTGPWVDFAADQGQALVLHEDGYLWGFGSTADSVLYREPGSYVATPVQITALGGDWAQISIADGRAAGIKRDGTLWTWGKEDNTGYLGQGIIPPSFPFPDLGVSPNTTSIGGNDWVSVGMGYSGFLATKKDGSLWGTYDAAQYTSDFGFPYKTNLLNTKSSFHSIALTRSSYHALSLGIDQDTGNTTYLSPYGDPVPTYTGKLLGPGASLIVPGPTGSYTSISESGNPTDVYITTDTASNIKNGETIYWDITGGSYGSIVPANSSDFSATSGSYTYPGGQYVTIIADNATEGDEGFVVRWSYGAPNGQPGSVTLDVQGLYVIGDTSVAQQGQVVYSSYSTYYQYGPFDIFSEFSPELEGSPVNHYLQYQSGYWGGSSENVFVVFYNQGPMDNYELQVTLPYSGVASWNQTSHSGGGAYPPGLYYFVYIGQIRNNGFYDNTGSYIGSTYNFQVTAINDIYVETNEFYQLDILIGTQSIMSNTLVARTGQIFINDAPYWTVTDSSTTNSIDEGGSVSITVQSGGQSNQTIYYVLNNLGGTLSSFDFASNSPGFSVQNGVYYNAVVHNNNYSSLTYTAAVDQVSDSGETFRIDIKTGDPVNGTVVASSDVISILDPPPPPVTAGPSTFQWFYYAYGSTCGTLTVYWRRNTGTMYTLRTISAQQHTTATGTWDEYVEDLSSYNGQTGKIVFRYLSGTSYTGDIQLDGMTFTDQNGNVTDLDPNTSSVRSPSKWEKWTSVDGTTSSYPTSTWSAVTITTSASGRWNYDLGGTPSSSTGGTRDSDGSTSGYYIYFETSSPNYPSKYGWLRTTNDLTI